MSLALESTNTRSRPRRATLPPAFEITGPPNAPVVAVLGGISSSRHVTSTEDDGSAGWWQDVVRADGLVDTLRCRVISIDYLGETAHGEPLRTTDQAGALARALDAAGVDRLHALVGASYGGMVALAFGAAYPHRVGRLVVISAAHASDPAATALRVLQRRVVQLGIAGGRPAEAVSIARGIAVTSYGTPAEFRARFAGDELQDGAMYRKIEAHLLAAGERFARTCSPARFLALSRSLDLHFVRPEDVRVPTTLVSVREDQLVPPAQARELAARLGAPCTLVELESIHGHDAFLNDSSLLAPVFAAALSTLSGSIS
ncbi:MAG: homoserine O-succinyltransferase [Gemmatimonadaceae bacterium]|nr:homoserine O-succinyltransferase [Gemmatimonadaceae bacterium]